MDFLQGLAFAAGPWGLLCGIGRFDNGEAGGRQGGPHEWSFAGFHAAGFWMRRRLGGRFGVAERLDHPSVADVASCTGPLPEKGAREPWLLVDLRLDEFRELAQGILPTEIAGLGGDHVRHALLLDIHLGADR